MLLKFGIISEVDAAKGVARVKFDGNDGMVSYWLPMAVSGTIDPKISIPFRIREHVYCIMDVNMESGVIAGSIYDSRNSPSGGDNDKCAVQFEGGLRVEYDRNAKSLSISGDGDLTININGTGKGKVDITCDSAKINSLTDAEIVALGQIKLTAPNVVCSGIFTAAQIAAAPGAGGDGSVAIGGDLTATGTIQGGAVKEGLIQLGTHKHTGVQTGGGTSGTPIP